MLNGASQQTISQYANDTSCTVCVDSHTLSNLVNILKEFSTTLDFGINWDKNIMYWCEKSVITPVVWVESLRWKWAKEKILFKLLGISFGLNWM